jgi:hypothetical protein
MKDKCGFQDFCRAIRFDRVIINQLACVVKEIQKKQEGFYHLPVSYNFLVFVLKTNGDGICDESGKYARRG